MKFAREFVESLNPATPMESEIAQNIADGYWRLKRARTTEDSLYALGHYEGQGNFDANHEDIHAAFTAAKTFREHSKAFVNLSIYEQRIQRSIDKNTRLLREIQTERKALKQAEMAEVLRLRDFNKMKSLPYNPQDDGFVYSSAEIETEASRRDRGNQAWQAAKLHFNYKEFLKMAA